MLKSRGQVEGVQQGRDLHGDYEHWRGVDTAVRTFIAVLHKEEDLYVAECPEVGTVSQGHIEEAIANLKEATELYLKEFSDIE